MTPETIIAEIDAWLTEHAWLLDEKNIDFALDVRRMVVELEAERTPLVVGSG